METGEFIGMKYSPGFKDRRGGIHSATLKKNKSGEWIIESRDRESRADSILVVTYSVDEEKLAKFVTFLKDENVAVLSKRKKSDEFIHDYSPWSISIKFDNSAIGGSKSEWYKFGQYQNYSDADHELIKEVETRFGALYGEKLSEKGGLKVETGEFIGMKYSPGFKDRRGGIHSATLKKNKSGEWIIESRDRESRADSILVVTYSVDEEKLAKFVTFLKDENVAVLSKRKKSDEFIHDYSPWSISIKFDNSAIGGSKSEWYKFGQYQNYSDADTELIKEVNMRFGALYGEKLSEESVED
ncbi:MAG: hypothetical protein Q4A19_05305 [Johnsonella sp.]|nr:hypothetical protein [Johnsonella sp.]